MIDLTPLDVRNKRGDFKKGMRGYDPQEVDVFLELVAERLEALVRENIQLRDRTQTLQEQVEAQAGREQAVQDALVTAQELRKDMREQSQREAEHIMREAESEARRMISEAEAEVRSRLRGVERQVDQSRNSLQELERRRQRFLQEFRGLLQRELDVVDVEEERTPLEDRTVDLDLGGRHGSGGAPGRSGGAGTGSRPERPASGSSGSPSGSSTRTPGASAASSEAPGSSEASIGDGPTSDASPPDGGGAGGELEAPEASTGEAPDGSQASDPASVAVAEADDQAPVDVADLQPGADESPPDRPSSLELELMAGLGSDDSGDGASPFPEVPDLETVLAEAGVDDAPPPESHEISPPPVSRKPADGDDRKPEDRLALFDKDQKGKRG